MTFAIEVVITLLRTNCNSQPSPPPDIKAVTTSAGPLMRCGKRTRVTDQQFGFRKIW